MFQPLCLLALAGSLAPALAHSIPSHGGRNSGLSRALYFFENDPAGAKLAAVGIDKNGSLGQVTEISTGGKGQQTINAADGSLLGPDSLVGQGAVAMGDDVCTLKIPLKGDHMLIIDYLVHIYR